MALKQPWPQSSLPFPDMRTCVLTPFRALILLVGISQKKKKKENKKTKALGWGFSLLCPIYFDEKNGWVMNMYFFS